MRPELRQWETIPTMVCKVVPILDPPIVHTTPIAITLAPIRGGEAQELRRDMKQLLDLMKNLNINFISNAGGVGRGRGRGSYEATDEGGPSGGRGHGFYGRRMPTYFGSLQYRV